MQQTVEGRHDQQWSTLKKTSFPHKLLGPTWWTIADAISDFASAFRDEQVSSTQRRRSSSPGDLRPRGGVASLSAVNNLANLAQLLNLMSLKTAV